MLKQTFKKGERLHSKKLISLLFETGNSFFIYPFKVVYIFLDEKREFPAEVLISVSKRKIKRAVKRNKVKRLIREAYRKNKYLIFDNNHGTLLMGLIYIADDVLEYKQIERKITLILQKLKEKNEESNR